MRSTLKKKGMEALPNENLMSCASVGGSRFTSIVKAPRLSFDKQLMMVQNETSFTKKIEPFGFSSDCFLERVAL